MIDAVVGRLLVASLHQGIADVLPTRLEFYEEWLSPAGLRDGRIGLAPLAAVLSFLRREGAPYARVAARAGEWSAEWTFASQSAFTRSMLGRMSPTIRAYFVMRIAGKMVRRTYRGSRALVRWKKGRGTVDIRGSIFCEVRERTPDPMCAFYVAAIRRLMQLFDIEVEVDTEVCRATGATQCLLAVVVRPSGVAA